MNSQTRGDNEMAILVAYASKHGATEGIARRIAEKLRQLGKEAEARSMETIADPGGYDAFVIGSAIYYGSWLKEAVEWVRSNQAILAAHPVWLFGSGPLGTEVKDDEPLPKEMTEFQRSIKPRGQRIFFGALEADHMSFGERVVAKAVHAPQGDFRDWGAIDAWAVSIAQTLE
jgi:menaquinone-dependent protoporphyrinogen oxidase